MGYLFTITVWDADDQLVDQWGDVGTDAAWAVLRDLTGEAVPAASLLNFDPICTDDGNTIEVEGRCVEDVEDDADEGGGGMPQLGPEWVQMAPSWPGPSWHEQNRWR